MNSNLCGSFVGRGHPDPWPGREEAVMEGKQVFVENLCGRAVSKDSEPGSRKMRSISRTII